ncbi:ABC transporter ATP-binding protein [Neisseriaceae bacterium JH1-16]|nr:ABC transporter ATP-binding protein [Neisseriaceae bacterium JH1-16]
MSSLSLDRVDWAPHAAPTDLILKQVSLAVHPGEFVGVIGPNGSGKTSSLCCAFRYHRPLAGTVSLAAQDIWQQPGHWHARHAAVVLQEFPEDFGLSVREVVDMGRTPHKSLFQGDSAEDIAIVSQALEQVGLLSRQHHPFETLSGGEKQRALLARALAQQPSLLILDEPTNHLDLRHQLELLRLVRRLGISTVATLHDLNLAAAFCDRLYVLQRGRIVADGSPAEVLTADLLDRVFGVRALVDAHPIAGHPRITLITQEQDHEA